MISLQILKKISYKLILTSLLAILSGILISLLFFLEIVPVKYFISLLILDIIIFLFIIYTLFSNKNKILNITAFFLVFLSILCHGIVINYLNTTLSFFKTTTSVNYQTEEYQLLVLKNSSYQTLSDLENESLGIVKNQSKKYQQELEQIKNLITITDKTYQTPDTAARALLSQEVSSLFISTSGLSLLKEKLPDFEKKVRVLKNKQVKINSLPIAKSNNDLTKKTFTIYISGIDISGNISKVSRSDVNMLATINPKTKQILLTSIPRDYYVQLSNTTGYRDKLTHSGIYGINMTTSTIKDLLNINIDYYVRVNFTTLITLVDTIGGIDLYSDKSFRAWTNGQCTYPEGMVHVDGACALAFARERYTYTSGDRHRNQNQQDVVKAIIEKVISSKTLITKYPTLLSILENSFQTNIPLDQITKLINEQIRTMSSWQIEQFYLNGFDSANYTYSYPNQQLYVMEPDNETIKLAHEKITALETNK